MGRQLLDRITVLRRTCDLDLLLFFARHPRSLLTSENIAAYLGYDLKDVADSLDVLSSAGIVTRSQTTHVARMYVFTPGGTDGGWLLSLIELASTREGRVALAEALAGARGTSRGPLALVASDRMAETG
ncbi:MAG: hypothetical protein ABI466_03150 [Chloroflexota bacterium]